MCYDEAMYKYDIPIFVINDPKDYKIVDDSKKQFLQKDIKIKIRQGAKDVELHVQSNEKVSAIIQAYLKASEQSYEEYNCKLLFGGKLMDPDNAVGVYTTSDVVIQGFTTKKPTPG